MPQNYLIRYENNFYRVEANLIDLKVLRRYCSHENIKFVVYKSKHKGIPFNEFVALLGLKQRFINLKGVGKVPITFKRTSSPWKLSDSALDKMRVRSVLMLLFFIVLYLALIVGLVVAV